MERKDLDWILDTVCREQAPAALISVDSGAICRGRLKTLSGRLVSLDLPQLPEGFDLQPLSQCVCLFRHGDGGCAFLALVQSFETHCSPAILFLHRPEDAACESRRAFRVPAMKQSPKVEMIGEDGKAFSAEPVDISVAGALVEFPGEEAQDFPVGTRFKVKLQLEESSVTVGAEVCRKYGKRYGLFFCDIAEAEKSNLSKLVNRVEQNWLSSTAIETED